MADSKLYEVERLLDRKLEQRRVYYLVRWKNFPPSFDTWEPAKNLGACYKLKKFYTAKKVNKSASVAAKLWRRGKALSQSTEEGFGVSSTIARKNSQIIARQKIAAELRSKSKHLTNLGSISARTLKMKNKTRNSSVLKMRSIVSKNRKAGELETVSEGNINSAEMNGKTEELAKPVRKAGMKRTSGALLVAEEKLGPNKKLKKLKDELDTSQAKRKLAAVKNERIKTPSDKVKNSTPKTRTNKNLPEENHSEKVKNSNASSGTFKNGKLSYKNIKSVQVGSTSDGKTTQRTSPDSHDHISAVVDSDTDDDDILYSLNDDIDAEGGWEESQEHVKEPVINSVQKNGSKTSSKKSSQKGAHSQRMSLLDSKRPKSSKEKPGPFDQLLRPSSPTPFFTPLKAVPGPQLGVTPGHTMELDSLVGDVPTIHNSAAGPLSPNTAAYKNMLESLPVPKEKKKGSNGTSTSSGSSRQSAQNGSPEPIERRISVRATECVFRYKQIIVKKCHRYTQIWLNTQTTLNNAINPQVVQEVVAALNTAKYDDSSLVLFSAVGKNFCSGVDLHFLITGDRKVKARQMADALRDFTKAFITFPKPVIAAVGGSAVGLGVALLCLCDVVYASDKASFHLPYSKLSQTPEGCSSFTLPQNLGLASANELLMGGRCITAMEANQFGLVSHVFWPTVLMQEVIPRAQSMAESSPKVLESSKLLTRSHHRTKMELTNETECSILLERWSTSECQQAIKDYLADEKNFSS